MIITGVDPGGTTGVATFVNGKPASIDQLKYDEFPEWLKINHPDLWVIEDYIIRPQYQSGGYGHQWNKGEALRIIGMLEYHAILDGTPLTKQQPSIKPMAAKLLGQNYKANSSDPYRHSKDAVLHVQWYLHKQGPHAT